jgi:hypothetical protein
MEDTITMGGVVWDGPVWRSLMATARAGHECMLRLGKHWDCGTETFARRVEEKARLTWGEDK